MGWRESGGRAAPRAAPKRNAKRNGGRHRCQPPLSGFAPRTPPHSIPVRFSCDQQPAKRCVAAHAGTIRRRFGRPPFGGRPHLESPSSSLPGLCRSSRRSKRWTAFPVPDRVRINSWESLRSVTRLSVDFLVKPVRSLLASLATTLDVPAVFRLCRPMI